MLKEEFVVVYFLTIEGQLKGVPILQKPSVLNFIMIPLKYKIKKSLTLKNQYHKKIY